ncbi:MAG: PIN domain-containing protein [Candidatus Acidiferrales bacterium]|jgi:hypothetical protein
MDVLLDSNIYLEDLKMRGNRFEELFTYLRRTRSSLLLPHLVREEVTAKYSERLKEASGKAQSTHNDLWKLAMSEGPQFTAPKLNQEVESLLNKLRSPAKGVRVVDVDDYRAVDMKEVVHRGAYRKRPASEKGEELRDVILWLLALTLARESKSGIVFISKDKTFADGERPSLHPDLISDVGSLTVPLEFYTGIREFVVAKALDHQSIDANHFYSIVPLDKVKELAMATMLQSTTRVGTIRAADFKEFEFERAIRYKVGDQAYFIEAVVSGSASLSVEDFPQYFTTEFSSEPVLQGLSMGATSPFVAAQVRAYEPSPTPFISGNAFLNIPEAAPWNTMRVSLATLAPKPRRYLCSFKVSLSARTVGDTPESAEVDSIQFNSLLPDEHRATGSTA